MLVAALGYSGMETEEHLLVWDPKVLPGLQWRLGSLFGAGCVVIWGRGVPLWGGLCCHLGQGGPSLGRVVLSFGAGGSLFGAGCVVIWGRGVPLWGGFCCHLGQGGPSLGRVVLSFGAGGGVSLFGAGNVIWGWGGGGGTPSLC